MSGNRPHRAFTLVELLTVIVIIGMLVALLIPAIGAVMRRTKDFRTATDIAKLEQAVELYKDKYGDYPPDFSELSLYLGNPNGIATAQFNKTTIMGHLRRAFPKITAAEVGIFKAYLIQELNNQRAPTQADAMFFWLGGLSGNVQRPFSGAGGPLVVTSNGSGTIYKLRVTDRSNRIFEFEDNKLVVNTSQTSARFLPKGLKSPLVYFNSKTYMIKPLVSFLSPQPSIFFASPNNYAIPYKSMTVNPNATTVDKLHFAKRNTFQIISAGVDNIFHRPYSTQGYYLFTTENGRPYHPPSAEPYNDPRIAGFFEGQEDNLTNFTEGRRLVDLQE